VAQRSLCFSPHHPWALSLPLRAPQVGSKESEELAGLFEASGRSYVRHGAAHILPAGRAHVNAVRAFLLQQQQQQQQQQEQQQQHQQQQQQQQQQQLVQAITNDEHACSAIRHGSGHC